MKLEYVIRVNALARLKNMIGLVSVAENFKLTKEDIIKYNIYNYKTVNVVMYDLFNELKFTKEEIINNKIYEAPNIAIGHNVLSNFTKEELIKYKIIDKAQNIPYSVLLNIGFSKKEIVKSYGEVLDGMSKKVATHFKGKTKKEVLEMISRMWSSDYKELDIDNDAKTFFKLLTLSMYDIDSTILPLDGGRGKSLKSFLNDKIAITKDNMTTLASLGHKPSVDNFDDFSELFISDRSSSLDKLSEIIVYRKLFKNDKELYDLCTKKLNSALYDHIYFDYFSLIQNKKVLEDAEEWNAIISILRTNMLSSSYRIATKDSKESDSYGGRYNYKNTVNFIKELKVTKDDIEAMGISKFAHIFAKDDLDDDLINDVIALIKSYGIEVDEEREKKIILNLLKYSSSKTALVDGKEVQIYKEDYYKSLINRNIDVIDSIKSLYNFYLKEKTNITSYAADRYRTLFAKGGEECRNILEEEIEEINNREFNLNVLKGLKNLYRHNGSDLRDRESWYGKYFPHYNKIPSKTHSWDKFANDIKTLWVLASIDEFDDFDTVSDWTSLTVNSGRGFSFDDNGIHSFAKGICGESRDLRDIKLSDEQKRKIYDWLLTKIDTTQPWVNKYMAVCYYLFDKERYNAFVEGVDTLKNNYIKTRGGSAKSTVRIDSFRYMLKYFKEKEDLESFKALINKLLTYRDSAKRALKMTDTEYKDTLKYLELF